MEMEMDSSSCLLFSYSKKTKGKKKQQQQQKKKEEEKKKKKKPRVVKRKIDEQSSFLCCVLCFKKKKKKKKNKPWSLSSHTGTKLRDQRLSYYFVIYLSLQFLYQRQRQQKVCFGQATARGRNPK